MRFPSFCAVVALCLLAPATASAASKDGTGDGVRHLANVAYPNLHNKVPNQGTDLELAKIGGRTYAFAGSYYDGLHVIDVTSPARPNLLKTYDCGVGQGDVQVFRRKDLGGRWFATYVQDFGYSWYPDSTCV